ncbi:calcium:proton antiporter [Ferrimonas marina]|uniref:Ca2+:H+ antiporter n=1 Tax=Ferrimonas marina TaxID=299255 RepID=A0A1M5RKH7_9GAMM|nr:calcium:proton antiporter [Ferrimonas marina]SHH26578.1 Ca2+:H+ antiporter [Ferrimonas marina]
MRFRFLRREWPMIVGLFALLYFHLLATPLAQVSSPLFYWGQAAALLAVVMLLVFAVVRHSDALAIKLGEPYGTLILTLSVILLEVAMITSVMLTGEPNPTMARDTMFAVTMMVLNGLLGVTLILGGLKFHSQTFNLDGARSYLSGILPLSLLVLVLPNFTLGGITGGLSFAMTALLIVIAVMIYGVFLLVQTHSHSHFFVDGDHGDAPHDTSLMCSNGYHAMMLVGYLLLVILLAKILAQPIDYGLSELGAPAALGGLIVAAIVLAPEGVGGIKAAMGNQLQRAVNLFFGSVLATIALTVPCVLLVAFFLDTQVILGLAPAEMVLLGLTLLLCKVSFSGNSTNVLHGVSHLSLFLVYLLMMFE